MVLELDLNSFTNFAYGTIHGIGHNAVENDIGHLAVNGSMIFLLCLPVF